MNNTTTIRLMAPLAVGAALVWFLGYPGVEGRWLSIALLLALCFISALRFGHSLKIQRQQPTPIASPLLSGLIFIQTLYHRVVNVAVSAQVKVKRAYDIENFA